MAELPVSFWLWIAGIVAAFLTFWLALWLMERKRKRYSGSRSL